MKSKITNQQGGLRSFLFAAWIGAFFFLLANLMQVKAQQITNYVLFAGSGGTGTTPPPSGGYCVQLASGAAVNSGGVGSYKSVITTGGATITGNVHARGGISLSNNNTVINGNVSASNIIVPPATGTIFSAGSNTSITGNIDVNGNIVIGSGTVIGRINQPAGATYSGSTPSLGRGTSPAYAVLPSLPDTNIFPPADLTKNYSTDQILFPGSYGNITLGGGRTITLKGPGIYVFNTMQNSGSFNKLVFDFMGTTSGAIRLYIHGDVNLGKLDVDVVN